MRNEFHSLSGRCHTSVRNVGTKVVFEVNLTFNGVHTLEQPIQLFV